MAWKIAKLFEELGLDLFPYAFGKDFTDETSFDRLSVIESKLDGLKVKELDDAIQFAKDLNDQENNRGTIIESKAQNLLGVIGIATAFITGGAAIFPEKVIQLYLWQIIVSVFLYVLIVVSLTMTILLAFKVIKVGKYKTITLDIDDIYRMAQTPLGETKKKRLAAYKYAFDRNHQTHDNKASYLIGSQIWFRNSILLFLALALILILGMIFTNGGGVPTVPNIPSQMSTVTVTGITTPTMKITVFSTPSKTITVTPSATSTKNP